MPANARSAAVQHGIVRSGGSVGLSHPAGPRHWQRLTSVVAVHSPSSSSLLLRLSSLFCLLLMLMLTLMLMLPLSGTRSAAAAASTSQSDPANKLAIPSLPCGAHFDYWSESCAAIGSQASRTCSHGGRLLDPTSCTTHFHPHSKSCGILKMGCQSMCRITAPSCSGGTLSFTATSYRVSSDAKQVTVAVHRMNGDNSDASVRLHIHSNKLTSPEAALASADIWRRSFVLRWLADDTASTKQIPLQIADIHDGGQVSVWLRDIEGASLGEIEHAAVQIIDNHHETGILDFAQCEYRVLEGAGSVTLTVQRRGGTVGEASVRLKYVGGTATPVGDFERIRKHTTLHWADGDGADKTFTLIIHDDSDPEPDETVEIALVEHEGVTIGQFCSVVVVVILNDDADGGPIQLDQTTKMLSDLLQFDVNFDAHHRHSFLSSFQSRTYAAGELVYRQHDKSTEFYVVESGSLDVLLSEPGRDAPRHLSTITAGGSFGAVQALYGTSRLTTVRAREVSRIWLVDRESLRRYQLSTPELYEKVEFQFLRNFMRETDQKPPVVLFPGLASSRLIAWREKQCRGFGIHVGDLVWVSVEKILQTLTTDSRCWLECLALGFNQTDPENCKLRPAEGTAALTELAPGVFTGNPTTIFGVVIKSLASELLYDVQSIVAVPYDWRLSPDMLEQRDMLFTSVRERIQFAVRHKKHPAIIMAHSQGNSLFLYFVDWLKLHYPTSWQSWLDENVWAYFGLGAPLLGANEPLRGIVSGLNMGLPISELQAKTLSQSFGSVHWFLPHQDTRIQKLLMAATKKSRKAREQQQDELHQLADHEDEAREDADFEKEHGQDLPVKFDEIIAFRFQNGTQRIFSSAEVSSGAMFGMLGEALNDTRFLDLQTMLREHYLERKPNPLAAPPTRPPVRHVVMLYGVNLPTDIGYVYSQLPNTMEPRTDATIYEDKGGIFGIKTRSPVLLSLANNPPSSTLDDSSLTRQFTGRYAGQRNVFGRSGDKTVPYSSLSWANTWHEGETNVTVVPSRKIEYYQHPIGQWGEEHVLSLMNTVEPEYTRLSSSHMHQGREFTTTVLEVNGLGHREIVKEKFTIKLITNELLGKVGGELRNNELFVAPASRKKAEDAHRELLARLRRQSQNAAHTEL
ncbi:hypothetical protein CAOG_08941 [Capsaspora owczarzaki ATCC 30864]|nr:hypothetical protein CAOG_08941 [Capsaspora owczarzaki ATCC 30864]|eukprot:XP_011270612.1 hypothetical protein CAOG_08941 [Capsaspora owczarzaki ATCC 30864]